jgi:hypothetical protein
MIPNDAPPVGRMRRRRPALVVVAVVAAVALIAVAATAYALNRGPDHHADGAGPLSSLGPGTKIGQAVDPTASGRVTFGVELCLLTGEDVAVIEAVEPSATVGTGFRFVGSLIRTFDLEPGVDSPHEPIGSVDGYPPPARFAPDHLSDAVGYAVQVRCQHDRPPPTYTELLLGFERTGETGGGWHGIDVRYAYAGRHRVVSLAYDFCFLGSLVKSECQEAGA